MINLQNISHNFGTISVLKDVSMVLNTGARVGLCGSNGSGKSTLINIATGFLKPEHGDIRIGDISMLGQKPWQFARQGIARTFQSCRLMKTVPMSNQLGVTRDADHRAHEMVRGTTIEQYLDAFVDEIPLSAQRQFEIIRALAQQPKTLFLDEPSAGLTPQEVEEFSCLVANLLPQNCTVIIVEHRLNFMRRLTNTVFELSNGILAERADTELEHV